MSLKNVFICFQIYQQPSSFIATGQWPGHYMHMELYRILPVYLQTLFSLACISDSFPLLVSAF